MIDPRICDIIAQAEKEHHRITACEFCNGPRIHSKLRPESKCFRCGSFIRSEKILQAETKEKCLTCKELFWSLDSPYCDKCKHSKSLAKSREQQRQRRGIAKGVKTDQ